MIAKKIIIGVLLLFAAAAGIKTIAISRLSKEEKVKRITEKMAVKLSLSEAQKSKVSLINLTRANGHEEAFRQGRNKEIIRKAVARWETDLKQVLTAEQAKKLKL